MTASLNTECPLTLGYDRIRNARTSVAPHPKMKEAAGRKARWTVLQEKREPAVPSSRLGVASEDERGLHSGFVLVREWPPGGEPHEPVEGRRPGGGMLQLGMGVLS